MTTDKPDHIRNPNSYLSDLVCRLPDHMDPDATAIDDMIAKDVCIEWHRFDEDDPKTWPGRDGCGPKVLGLIEWTKGDSYRYGSLISRDSKVARFFQAAFGEYSWIGDVDDRECVFFLDHGNGDEDDTEDYVQPPKYWTYIADPQRIGLE